MRSGVSHDRAFGGPKNLPIQSLHSLIQRSTSNVVPPDPRGGIIATRATAGQTAAAVGGTLFNQGKGRQTVVATEEPAQPSAAGLFGLSQQATLAVGAMALFFAFNLAGKWLRTIPAWNELWARAHYQALKVWQCGECMI